MILRIEVGGEYADTTRQEAEQIMEKHSLDATEYRLKLESLGYFPPFIYSITNKEYEWRYR